MSMKKCAIAAAVSILVLASAYTEVFTWQANTGKQYETTIMVHESVIGLSTRAQKPPSTTQQTVLQETVAIRQSTIPYIQHLPSFPKGNIEPGDSWKAPAIISINLAGFGIQVPVEITVMVTYQFIGKRSIDNRSYDYIAAEWHPFLILPKTIVQQSGIERLSGYSRMHIWWDNVSGSPKKTQLSEELQYRFDDASSLMTHRVTEELIVTIADIARKETIAEISRQITTAQVADIQVKQVDEGIVLSMENIQFEPESARLTAAEQLKIEKVGTILESLGNRELKIVGHAADPGQSDTDELIQLSTERAQAVAEFLVTKGFRQSGSIMIEGKGAQEPLGDNSTTEGRSKNRRVEIIIMDEGDAQ